MAIVTLEELLKARVHYGHHSSRWNPKMFPYIYSKQHGIHVIDLVKTVRLLTYAYDYVQTAAKENKTFLFIGTKDQASAIVAKEAQKCDAHYVNNRWLGGILTNWSTVQLSVNYLISLDMADYSGKIDALPKKEAASLRRRYDKLNYSLGGLREMKKIPDIAIVVDPRRESIAVAECRRLQIPIISIIDTNSDPNLVDIPIPANDDAKDSIQLILSILANGIVSAKSL